ncbi:L-threonylcarbamoyladenylate synthase [Cellulomonas sp. URHB0016]
MPDIRTYDDDTRRYAVELLGRDGVIIAPSVTNYGVFCSATSKPGIERIFEMKERSKFGPLTLGIGDPADSRKYADIPANISEDLVADLLLNLTTLVFLKAGESEAFPPEMTMGAPTVGLFCHGTSPMWEIGRDFGPIALTSSNISGTGGAQVTREQAINDLGEHADLVIDGGPIVWDDASGDFQSNTVVDFSFDTPYLVRAGRFPTEKLRQHFPDLVTDFDAYRAAMTARLGGIRL